MFFKSHFRHFLKFFFLKTNTLTSDLLCLMSKLFISNYYQTKWLLKNQLLWERGQKKLAQAQGEECPSLSFWVLFSVGKLPDELQMLVEDPGEYKAPQDGNVVYKLFSLDDLLLLVRCNVQKVRSLPRFNKKKKAPKVQNWLFFKPTWLGQILNVILRFLLQLHFSNMHE